jgi:hypothetical protein
MSARSVVAIAAVLAAGSSAMADDVMRCGTAIVDVGMTAGQVVAKCGEPMSTEVETAPIKRRTASGGVTTTGTTRIERWTYDRGYGQFPALLTFTDGKLKSIELLTSR